MQYVYASCVSYNHIIQEFEILDFPSKEANISPTLSFDEVVHIRRVISRAELLDLQLKNMTLFWEVWKNKVVPLSVCVCTPLDLVARNL